MSTEKNTFHYVPDQVFEAFKANGMTIIGEYEMVEGTQFELEAYTPGGGDMLHTIELGEGEEGDLFAWRDAFQEIYDNFDPWREAHLWLDEEGNPTSGVPFWDGIALYEDIKRYDEETLEATLDDLKELALSA